MTKAAPTDDTPGTRERIVAAASHLMQRRGYDGTGVKQISIQAGATLGSVYHFFPGGKKELALAAIERGDREFAEELERILAAEEDPAEAMAVCARVIADGLRESDWADGCPVTSTALGVAVGVPEIGRAADAALARWRSLVAEHLIAAGVAEEDARDLGYTVISTLEGAETAAQLARDDTPLRIAGRHLARLVRLHLP
ncbi:MULTISPECIES: TetR/AcrR family transcriptional regulator [unclassified Nocardiopsis]|uniref:TetR/AcrR family transcriptional regulator n=1 Tax=Nocardiopsis TaxID=2013 RepID=UPI00387B6403